MTMRTIVTSRIAALALAGALGLGTAAYAATTHDEGSRRTAAFECNADSCNPTSCNWMWGSYPGTGSGC
ncbi:hypothetical protein ACFU5Z_08690 [Streptomyces sp. NPDC057521]|uniref:hypothetical protein n=1 Tax=Streptomyces sp. NPDC057521 TaxID=3346156 RepID=UPI0036B9CE33